MEVDYLGHRDADVQKAGSGQRSRDPQPGLIEFEGWTIREMAAMIGFRGKGQRFIENAVVRPRPRCASLAPL